jgi:cytochrome c peroxidase
MKSTFLIFILLSIFSCAFFSEDQKPLPKNKQELGALLFFEKTISLDSSVSCASCHLPDYHFADTVPLSKGVGGKFGHRNTPSVTNMASRSIFFWDGRANSLEEQALFPIRNPIEMNLPVSEAIKRLKVNPYYVKAFKTLYNQEIDSTNLGDAIAAFESSLETTFTPFDKFMDGDSSAISKSAMRGQVIFNEKGNCFDCHFGPDFTGDEFKNIGLFNGRNLNDSGRFIISKNSSDIGAFKVPGLRNVGLTAPYMHNGMFQTLEEVIEYYNNPAFFVPRHINRDSLIKPLNLNSQEKIDLAAFLRTLNN